MMMEAPDYSRFLDWFVENVPADDYMKMRGARDAGAFFYKKNPGQVENDVRNRRESRR